MNHENDQEDLKFLCSKMLFLALLFWAWDLRIKLEIELFLGLLFCIRDL